VAKLWGNRYHFNGGTPADLSHWNTLADAITTAEKAIFAGDTTIVKATYYHASDNVPVGSKTYSLSGTGGWGASQMAPGDAASLMRYATTARTSKNHPIYLFNYYHGVYQVSNASRDSIVAAQVTALNAYAAAWIAGFSDGTTTYVRAGPNGATATGYALEPFITHRDFRR
jgi:hypothetical protein